MIKIAIYGKGGIGKSTISSNISAALAMYGKNVLQIGCDPKHDSTRLLLGGNIPTTVLNYIRETPPERRDLKDLIFKGYGGVACVEAGGPEPGVGCGGRGILTTFELLRELGIQEIDFDYTIYDVLGDVVCGGFAVPLRREYADAVILVTSGEYMALYAVNNILRGIRNYHGSTPKVAGLIHNGRGLELEDKRVEAFTKTVKIPVIASIPRNELFAKAERLGQTVIETFPDSMPTLIFKELVHYMENLSEGKVPLYPALPLDDEDLEMLVLDRSIPNAKRFIETVPEARRPTLLNEVQGQPSRRARFTRNAPNGKPLHGCAFAGAVVVSTQIEGAFTIIHGPNSCAHIISNFLSANNIVRHDPCKEGLSFDNLFRLIPTQMTDDTVIFGGLEDLRKTLEKAYDSGCRVVFIITTCLAGMIGDDVQMLATMLEELHPDMRVVYLRTDGNLGGDFSQGLIKGFEGAIQLIDPHVDPESDMVNIVGEKILSSNKDRNFSVISDMLEEIGLKVNCRFVADTDIDSIRSLRKADLNILAYDDDSDRSLRRLLEDRGLPFFELPYPVGFHETARWIRSLAERYGREDRAEELIEEAREEYKKNIQDLRPLLEGKRALVITYSQNVLWVLETLTDLGIDVLKVCFPHFLDKKVLNYGSLRRYPIHEAYSIEDRKKDMSILGPDIVLSSFPPSDCENQMIFDTIPLCPNVGFESGIELGRRLETIVRLPRVEGWKKDEELFR